MCPRKGKARRLIEEITLCGLSCRHLPSSWKYKLKSKPQTHPYLYRFFCPGLLAEACWLPNCTQLRCHDIYCSHSSLHHVPSCLSSPFTVKLLTFAYDSMRLRWCEFLATFAIADGLETNLDKWKWQHTICPHYTYLTIHCQPV